MATKTRVLCLFISGVALANSATQRAGGDWRFYGHDPGGTRFSELRQVNRFNVARLQRVWTYHTGEIKRLPNAGPDIEAPAFECTPLMVNDLLYLSTPSGRVIALDAEIGTKVWEFDSQSGSMPRKYHQHRGVSYWEGSRSTGPGLDRRILFGTFDGRLIALDAGTGKTSADFGKGGVVDLREGAADQWPDALYAISSPPAIYRDLVITGARLPERPSDGPSGIVRAFDVRTGQLIWKFHTVPQPGEPGHETWEGNSWRNRTGANVWSIISVDAERGLIFLPIGSPADDFHGGDRKSQNLFGNSLVALDAATGKLVWYYQMVHHDLWDYDLPAQPNLVTLRREHRDIPAVIEVTKMGLVFVLDRRTGRPLFPVEERSVPRPADSRQFAWPTQPFPVKPPALSRLSVTASDLSSVTPEAKKYCGELFGSLVGGKIFTPIGCEPTLFLPGTLGGATWSGASFDPSSGYLYVNVNEVPIVAARDCTQDHAAAPPAVRKLRKYARFTDQNGWPCLKPPWGTLSAVNLNSGEIVWKVPLGAVDELTDRGVPKTGTKNLGGSIVTAGGLVFIGATVDSRFRAFDSRTGEELWSEPVDAPAHATPVTYRGKSGRQFVVIAAGGGGYFSSGRLADSLIAYALPR